MLKHSDRHADSSPPPPPPLLPGFLASPPLPFLWYWKLDSLFNSCLVQLSYAATITTPSLLLSFSLQLRSSEIMTVILTALHPPPSPPSSIPPFSFKIYIGEIDSLSNSYLVELPYAVIITTPSILLSFSLQLQSSEIMTVILTAHHPPPSPPFPLPVFFFFFFFNGIGEIDSLSNFLPCRPFLRCNHHHPSILLSFSLQLRSSKIATAAR